ncbi:AAA family ATPase [Methanocaldococcus fervens]|uniref:Endonuclease GajA/Old nuclease/RecF-like AAA domain-containing protein n=1 Tax=Methanocaldococcus fervens (strain DSM 4213 / JCM 15782 / AG86) TaxID=573064 RepID=C7P5A3_METFA|nr:AAA family ATPase [Methanocaldococcus fervens]ACV25281.1 hypothetical protein Mefer_1478 [Methanocaldococcus fervens AG86]
MKIRSIHAKNLFSFDDFKITFDDRNIITIFGSNNVGKTNLFRVLKLLKNIINRKISPIDLEVLLHEKNKKMAEINVEVLFDECDKEIISKFLRIFFKVNSPEIINLCNHLKLNVMSNIANYFSEGIYVWECSEVSCREPYFILKLKNLEEDIEKIMNYLIKYELDKITPDLIDHSEILHDLNRNVETIKLINDLKGIIVSSINAMLSTYKESNRIYFNTLIDGEENITQIIGDNYNLIKEFRENLDIYVDFIKKLNMDEKILTVFIILLSLNELLINKMSINIDKVLEYVKENPWDTEVVGYLKEIFEFCKINSNDIKEISLNTLLLKIYEDNIITYEYDSFDEMKLGLSDPKFAGLFKCLLENRTIEGSDNPYLLYPLKNWISNYLFCLKNNTNLKLRKKYMEIKAMFEYIFEDENLTFDVILVENRPEITVYSGEFEIPIDMVGLSIKKILEILTLIFGYEGKVILLDTPFANLHPKYQKKLIKILKNKNIKSQIFVIIYSHHFIDEANINNTFRFYIKDGEKSTKFIRIRDVMEKLEKTYGKKYILDTYIKKIFLSDISILISSNIDVAISDLAGLPESPIDEYVVEVIRLKDTKAYIKYLSLLEFTKIPYILMLSEWEVYSLYEREVLKEHDGIKIRYKLMDEGKYQKEMENYIKFFEDRAPFWLSKEEFNAVIKEFVETMENYRRKLKTKGYATLTTYEEVIGYCINPLKERLNDIIRKKLFIYTYPKHADSELRLKEFKEFFEYFVKHHKL